jgi:hypothetical protein
VRLPRFARNDSGGKARNDTPSFVIARHTSAEAISHTPPRLPRFARNDNKGKARNDNLKGLAVTRGTLTLALSRQGRGNLAVVRPFAGSCTRLKPRTTFLNFALSFCILIFAF